MKFYHSVGRFLIVASEVVPPKSGGKIHVLEDSEFARGKVMAEPSEECKSIVEVDDEILFVRKDGVPIGFELPQNVVVIPLDSVVAVIDPYEEMETK
ncbi:MAG: hypothetical protein WC516_05075 [Patescibacteria group bacterium]|jgi:hypothetical protein